MGIARGTAIAVLAGALGVGGAVAAPSASAAPPDAAAGSVRWSVPLTGGDAVGVQVLDGTVRLSGDWAAAASALSPDGHGEAHAPGLLTLPARRLASPVDRVDATVALAPGSTAAGVSVDIRGLRSTGWWSEWVPAEPVPAAPGASTGLVVRAVLPDPATQVQARLVLEPAAAPGPAVRGLALTAYPAAPSARAQASRPAQHFLVYGTREGLVGGTTANGHKVTPHDLFVALPSRRALSPRNTSDYSVKVCAPSGRCAYAPVWDVGPWNTRDDYWNPSNQRQNWRDLPRGVPEAQAARAQNYNRGKDQFGRVVKNPAGIDLADGLFWDALGLRDNAWVTVDYLWTGDSPLSTVRVNNRVDLRDAPNPGARVVGLVADRAAVPVQCVTGAWLRIGAAQFLPATSVPRAQLPKALPTCR